MNNIKFRKNIRLKNYNYKSDGYYFVTIVTRNRMPFLKEIKRGVEKAVLELPVHINGLKIDYYIVMDTHIHIIFVLENCDKSLGQIVRSMKYNVNNVAAGLPSRNETTPHGNAAATIWQHNYYEHVIRNENALKTIRIYIKYNPEIEKINFKQFYE